MYKCFREEHTSFLFLSHCMRNAETVTLNLLNYIFIDFLAGSCPLTSNDAPCLQVKDAYRILV